MSPSWRRIPLLLLTCSWWPVAAGEVVFVAGGSGRTGIEIVRALEGAGYTVRAGTRDINRARGRHGDHYHWMAVDLLDVTALDRAVAGTDIVVAAHGSVDITGRGGPQFVSYLGTRNLVEIAVRHNVQHFVLLGAANTGPFEDHTRVARSGYLLYWKTKGEEFLKRSGLPYTIVGPGGLRDADGAGPGVRILPRAEYQWPGYVSRQRVAEIILRALREPNARNRAFALVWDDEVPAGEMAGSFAAMPNTETGPRQHLMPMYRW